MQIRHGISDIWMSPTQCSRGGHTQLQSPLPQRLGWRSQQFLPQTEITINLIQQSNATPNVLAYAHLSGPFDYNKMLLALMGCEAQVHEKTNKCGTWAYHLVDG